MWLTLKLDTPQARIFRAERKFSNAFTTPERSVTPFGQCNMRLRTGCRVWF